MITITPVTRIRKLLRRLGPLLRDLEERDVGRVSVRRLFDGHDDQLLEELENLGVQYAARLRTPGTGQLHWTMEGSGGAIDSEGRVLPGWIVEELLDPRREDVLSKLGRTSAPERWVFVPVVSGGAPWSVESYLNGELEYLPPRGPNLPPPVTGIWVTLTYGQRGVRWDGAGWRFFTVTKESSVP